MSTQLDAEPSAGTVAGKELYRNRSGLCISSKIQIFHLLDISVITNGI
jgi:hypothetical protein